MVSLHHTYRVREPAVAGAFYPKEPGALLRQVTDLLTNAVSAPRHGVRGVIAPHAGYMYSGAIAAEAFGCLRDSGHRFRRAVVIGPSHHVRFTGLAAPSQEAFATPMGLVPVDCEAIEALVSEGLAAINDAPHGPDHAVEVELPFLQAMFGTMAIVPLLFGETSAAHVANAIRRLWDDDTLLVVSSDLSHYEPYDSATAHDARTAAAIEGFDQAAIGPFEACGHMAIRGMLLEAQERGYSIERLDLRNSGDTSSDRRRVVGYGAWAIGDMRASKLQRCRARNPPVI